jgi:hypothetical protein
MDITLLFVSNSGIPANLTESWSNESIQVQESRGPMKTRQILEERNTCTIIWFIGTEEEELLPDLIQVFNEFPTIPVVMITTGLPETDMTSKLKSLFGQLDIDDEEKEITDLILKACNHFRLHKTASKPAPREIEFKNVVHHISTDPTLSELSNENNVMLEISAPWNAVDNKEKNIIGQPFPKKRTGFFRSLFK